MVSGKQATLPATRPGYLYQAADGYGNLYLFASAERHAAHNDVARLCAQVDYGALVPAEYRRQRAELLIEGGTTFRWQREACDLATLALALPTLPIVALDRKFWVGR